MKKIITAILLIGVFLLSSCSTPENIDLTKDYPSEVNVWDIFELKFSVKNNDIETRELRSFDFSSTFFEWFLVKSVSPEISEEFDIFWIHVYEFKKDIEKDTQEDVVFTLKALKQWDYSSDLDLCIDGDTSCIYNTIRVIVNEEEKTEEETN